MKDVYSPSAQRDLFPAADAPGFGRRHLTKGFLVAGFISALLAAQPAGAVTNTYSWSGATSANMSGVPANWGGTVPTATDVALWNTATYTRQPTANANMTMGEMLFGSSSGAVAFSTGSGTLTLMGISGVGLQMNAGAGAVTFGSAKFALGAAQSWTNNSSNTMTLGSNNTIDNGGFLLTVNGTAASAFSGIISGTGGLAISNGAVTLSAANTFSGGVALSSGTLILGNTLSLGAATNALTITGGSVDVTANRATANNLNLNGDFTYVGSNTWTDSGTVTLGGNRTITDNASLLVFSGNIVDSGSNRSLTKSGNGAMTLSGSNSFGGGMTLNAGTLNINNKNALGTGTFTINGGTIDGNNVTLTNAEVWNGDFTYAAVVNPLNLGTGTVTLTNDVKVTTNLSGAKILTVGGNITGAHSLTKDGAGSLTLTGSSDFSGGLKILSGTLIAASTNGVNSLGTGTITLGDTSGANSASYTTANIVSLNNPWVIAAGSTGTLSIITTGNANPVYSGTMSLNNNLTVSHAATTTTKTTTFSGPVVEDSTAHTITVGSDNTGGITFSGGMAIGTGGLTVTVANGATSGLAAGGLLRITGGVTSSTTSSLTLQNNSAVDNGIIISGSAVNFAGLITNAGTGAGSVSISSAIGSSVTGVVQNSATSLLTLSGSNSYSGTTTISAGTIQLGSANALGTSSLAVTAGTLDLAGNSASVGQLSGGATGLITSSTTSAVTFSANSNGNSTYGGSIANGSGTVAFTKLGTGTLTFSGSNTYSGATTVSAGTLLVNGYSGNSNVTVNNTATLSGTGTVRSVTVVSGGTLTPGGNNSAGILNSGTLSLNSGASLVMTLTGTTGSPVAGTNYSELNVTGGVTLGGALALNLTNYVHTNGGVFFLINNDGVDAVSGVFSNATSTNPATIFTLDGVEWRINYNADFGTTTAANFNSNLGNDVALLATGAVPEPSTWALLGLSTGTLVLFSRRRRAS